jgi:hypothetical protein
MYELGPGMYEFTEFTFEKPILGFTIVGAVERYLLEPRST